MTRTTDDRIEAAGFSFVVRAHRSSQLAGQGASFANASTYRPSGKPDGEYVFGNLPASGTRW